MKPMHFVFINPPRKIQSNNIWSIINSQNPPLGLALLAAIWDRQGHSSQIIDAAALNLSAGEIIERINPATDFVGITATTPEISLAEEIARLLREKLPRIRIIMGGAHPTVFHRELIRDGVCDMVVRNEGEEAVTMLAGGMPCDSIPNLTWRNADHEIIVNRDAETYADLNKLPLPAYDKLPMHLYHSALGAARKSPSVGMVTSRGCPGKCNFCFSRMFGSKIRHMSPERIIEHIDYLQTQYGIREISFYDDTFTAARENIADLCRLIIKKKIKISWSCFARVDSVTPELLILMNQAGCHQIMYGFETTDAEILKNINKKTEVDQFQKAVDWTRAAKINIRGAFMLGNPGETVSSMEKTIDFAKRSGLQFAVFNITTPYPGTALYHEYSQKKALLHRNWDLYNLSQPVLNLDTVSGEHVMQYYYKSYRDFYLRPAFIIRHILAIRSFSQFSTYAGAALKITALLSRNFFSR